jgi:hypothetical protein
MGFLLTYNLATHCLGREPKARVATTGVAIVDNIELTIQVGGHTPKVILLDTSAQLVILGVQFAKKMGMFDFKL